MTVDNVFSLIGITAAILTSSGLIPQAVKGFQTKSLRDVSGAMLVVLIAGTFLWLLYGMHKRDPILMCANIVTCSVAILILIMKIKFDRQNSSRKESSDE